MRKSKYTDTQIANALAQVRAGMRVAQASRALGVSNATLYNWRKLYGTLSAMAITRQRELQAENHRLTRLVSDLSLDKKLLQEIIRKGR